MFCEFLSTSYTPLRRSVMGYSMSAEKSHDRLYPINSWDITVQIYIDKLRFSYKVRINRWLEGSRSDTKPDVIGYVHHDNWLTVKR